MNLANVVSSDYHALIDYLVVALFAGGVLVVLALFMPSGARRAAAMVAVAGFAILAIGWTRSRHEYTKSKIEASDKQIQSLEDRVKTRDAQVVAHEQKIAKLQEQIDKVQPQITDDEKQAQEIDRALDRNMARESDLQKKIEEGEKALKEGEK